MEREQGDNAAAVFASAIRFGWVCAHVQHIVEVALKALIHLSADRETPAWGYDINKLWADLTDTHRRAVRSLMSESMADDITRWHKRSRYWDDQRLDDPATPEMAKEFTRAGCAVASYVARQFDDEAADARRVLDLVATLETRLACYDLLTGQPIEPETAEASRPELE